MAVCEPGRKRDVMDGKREEQYSKIAYGSFYAGVVIEVLMVLIDKSEYINPIEGRLFQFTFLLFAVKVLLTKYSLKEYVTIIAFGALGLISYFVTGRNEILRLVMFAAACKNVDIKRCLKLVFYLTLSGCAVLVMLSLTGIYGAASLTMDYGRGSEETRYMLGLGHPNALQCMVWALTVLFLYLYGEKLKWYGYLCLLAVNGFFFYLTDSKTSLLVAVFAIVYAGILALVKNDIFRKLCCVCGGLLTVFVIVFSEVIAANAYRVYYFHWHWDWSEVTEIFLRLDDALTGRIHSLVGTERWEGTPQTWSLFSEPANNYYFDFGWIRLIYWYGIIPAVIFIGVMLILMWYCAKRKEYMAFVMITAFAVYSFSEAHGISVYLARNYVFFLMGAYWNEMFHVRSDRECYWWQMPGLIREKV
ncbi:MAG: hypothetical protein NC400_00665 [Clostridium sp.]|nr:hypothetical protein [Clostridium sp.]